jgi:hypothetical protein
VASVAPASRQRGHTPRDDLRLRHRRRAHTAAARRAPRVGRRARVRHLGLDALLAALPLGLVRHGAGGAEERSELAPGAAGLLVARGDGDRAVGAEEELDVALGRPGELDGRCLLRGSPVLGAEVATLPRARCAGLHLGERDRDAALTAEVEFHGDLGTGTAIQSRG